MQCWARNWNQTSGDMELTDHLASSPTFLEGKGRNRDLIWERRRREEGDDGGEQMIMVKRPWGPLAPPFLFSPWCRLGLRWRRQQRQPGPVFMEDNEIAVGEHRRNRFLSRTQANQASPAGRHYWESASGAEGRASTHCSWAEVSFLSLTVLGSWEEMSSGCEDVVKSTCLPFSKTLGPLLRTEK